MHLYVFMYVYTCIYESFYIKSLERKSIHIESKLFLLSFFSTFFCQWSMRRAYSIPLQEWVTGEKCFVGAKECKRITNKKRWGCNMKVSRKRTDRMHRPNPHDVYVQKKKLCYAIDSTHFDMYLYEIRDVLQFISILHVPCIREYGFQVGELKNYQLSPHGDH